MKDDLPRVRLSRDGYWAVCTAIDCGVRFAQRIEVPPILKERQIRPAGSRPVHAVLDFGPGWVLDRYGVWRMSARAWKRLSKGKQPSFRRKPFIDMLGLDPRFEEPRFDTRRDRSHRPESHSTNAHRYPVVVVCPACGCEQVADRDALRLR